MHGKNKNLTLNDTLHVPNLRSNLISVAKITDRKMKVIFSEKHAEVINSHGDVKMVADRIGDLYFAREASEHAQNMTTEGSSTESKPNPIYKSPAETWHKRLGHLNYKNLYAAWKKDLFREMNLPEISDDMLCEICLKGKMTALLTI